MGSPQNPDATQIATLENAGKLEMLQTENIKTEKGEAMIKMQLPRQAVSLIKLSY